MTKSPKVATIKILNEIKCAVIGLRREEYYIFYEKYGLFSKGYQFNPMYKLRRWDGKQRFFTENGLTYIHLLDEIIPVLKEMGYTFKLIDKRTSSAFIMPEIDETYFQAYGITLAPHQVGAINAIAQAGNGIILAGTGAGKAQPLYSKVLTPGGWTTMGEISTGDLVSTPDGKTATVTATFPQGQTECFRLTFCDGTSVDASDAHLWEVYISEKPILEFGNLVKKSRTKTKHILTTNQLVQYRDETIGSDKRIGVRIPDMVDMFSELSAPIDPYLIGVLIGDGGISHFVSMSTADQEILDRIATPLSALGLSAKKSYGHNYRITKMSEKRAPNVLLDHLRSVKLMGTNSHTKFIPRAYKEVRASDRLELIRGLMDTDGTITAQGGMVYYTTGLNLAEDFVEIVRSLGCKACVSIKHRPKYSHKGEQRIGKPCYVIHFSSPDNSIFVSLSRKKNRCTATLKRREQLFKTVVSIEPIGMMETKCISISHSEKLYITDGFTITHNSIATAVICDLATKHNGAKNIVIVPNKDLITQTRLEITQFGIKVGEYSGSNKDIEGDTVVSTWQALQNNPTLLNVFNSIIVDECFHPDTPVKTVDGWKPIKDIVVGDEILNFNENTREFKKDSIVKVHENLIASSEDFYELEFDNGSILKVTGNHKFLTMNRGWIRADELDDSDDLVEYA